MGRRAVSVRLTICFATIVATAAAQGQIADVTSNPQVRFDPTPRPTVAASTTPGACHSPDGFAAAMPATPPATLPLRGDPGFDPHRLSVEARRWYDRLWDAITNADRSSAITALAASDDLYQYSRAVHTHVLALLTAFRTTGELALLDEVDRLAEHMRAQLRDPWRDTVDRTDGTRDGFVNWVFRAGGDRNHEGKDIHAFDEMRTHALVAEIAWAFHNNRDLTSPNGVDYGQRADAWTTYLLWHFEEKWRTRNETPGLSFPFVWSASLHATVSFIKYHHYLASITGSAGHGSEAARLTRFVQEHMRFFELDGRSAVVWPRLLDEESQHYYLQPTTYARYVIGDLVDLHLDGAPGWPTSTIDAVAHTLSNLVLDLDDSGPTIARDIGGGAPRAGLDATDSRSWSPPTLGQHNISPTSFAAAWDPTGLVAAVACAADEAAGSSIKSVHLPAALLLAFSEP